MACMSKHTKTFHQIAVGVDRTDDILDVDQWANGFADFDEPTDEGRHIVSTLELSRTYAVVPDDAANPDATSPLVGIHSVFTLGKYPVPGGQVPAAGLTWVGVHPQYRRRGILTSMIDSHLADCARRGEAIATLFAQELSIYQRFGYGLAANSISLTVPRGAEMWDVEGSDEYSVRLERADFNKHGELVRELQSRLCMQRPGMFPRISDGMIEQSFIDFSKERFRNGHESLRIAIVERDGVPAGFALFKRHTKWGATGPDGTVFVREQAIDGPAAAHALWSVLFDLDLMSSTVIRYVPTDDPLLRMLKDQRSASPKLNDNLFVRIVDIAAALSGRRYQCPLDTVIEVTDARMPANAGRWRIRTVPDDDAQVGGRARSASNGFAVEVTHTEDAPEIGLDVRELGAIYLGGVSLKTLFEAGLVVEHVPGAVLNVSLAFGWHTAPFSEVF